MTDDQRQATRRRRAAAMVQRDDWYGTDDYAPDDPDDTLPSWMVVVSLSDEGGGYGTFAYFYDTQERALADLRRLMVQTGETPEHLLDLDTGNYRDIHIETVFTLADTFSGDPDEEEEEE